MRDNLIVFKTAKLLYEKGIDFGGEIAYTKDGKNCIDVLSSKYNPVKYPIEATNQYLLQKWLREEHKIVVESIVFDKGFLERGKFCYQWRIYNNSNEWFTNTTEYKTYEEALEKALIEALKLLPNKK